jgi:hypothetical protein
MMKPINKKTLLFLLVLVLICPIKSYVLLDAQDIRPSTGEPPKFLFQSDELLYLTLSMDVKTAFLEREEEEDHLAEISYTDPEGNKTTLPIKISVRGNFRKDRNNCDFPPLRLNFSDSTVINTIFDGQDKIKLVTHCRSRLDLYEQNVLKEYLAYKLYNLFAEESYLVRLVHLTYADVKGKLDTLKKMAFFIEPTKQMAYRNGCAKLEVGNIHQTRTNQHKTVVMAIFQYMIGNTDWSVWVQHNIVLLKEDTSDLPIVIPYDFDWSGLVNAPYAVPAEILPIETVRTRLYRGFCRTDAEVQLALDEFRQRKDEIYQTCNSVPFLSEKELKKTLQYMDDFFKIIENPKTVKSEFHDKCRSLE